MIRSVLTIAGSDSGAGAGIQADLKTFAAHGVYGTSVITAITAQNTRGVTMWEPVSPELVRAQIQAVVSDIRPHATKLGMLGNVAIVHAVADVLRIEKLSPVVLDPVMIAKGGSRLLEQPAVQAIRTLLLPLAAVVTPNIPEAEVLAQTTIKGLDDMRDAAQRILALGPRVVLVKGGHLEGPESVDVAVTAQESFELRGRRIDTTSTHGTGCTLASAIAANLALGLELRDALTRAREYVEGAILQAPAIGTGHGPLHHFWRLY